MKSPKAVRITFLGQPLHRIYPHASRYQVFKYRLFRALRWLLIRTGIAAAAFTALTGAYFYGQLTAPNMTATNQIVAAVTEAKSIPAILHKICMAESGCKQFAATGLPIMHANTNGSVDIGKFQINSKAWGQKAKELGYDLLTEEGNEAMAMWILNNRGTSDWYSSEHGWK